MHQNESLPYNALLNRVVHLERGFREMYEMNALLHMQMDLLKKKVEGGETTESDPTQTMSQSRDNDLSNLQKALSGSSSGNKVSKSVSIMQ